MSCSILRNKVSQSYAEFIRKNLCLYPENPDSKYNQFSSPEPINFYLLRNGVLHLPFIFAACLFQIVPNLHINFPRTPLTFTGTLREKQIQVEQEALAQLVRYHTTTLALYPGFGKTILGAKLAARARLITLVLVHREILTTQWKKTFTDVTNARIWIVGEKNPPPICDVIICMDTRYNHIPPAIRDVIGFVIIDEAHAFCTPSRVECLLAFHPKYIVIESASLERDDGLHTMMYNIVGTHGVFRESSNPFSVIKVITNTRPVRVQNKMGGVDWSSLVQNTLMNVRRNRIIIELVKANIHRKILILTSLREHANLLYNILQGLSISSDYLCGTKKGYIDSTVLVGTTSKIGTGFDPATSCPTYAGKPFDLLLLVCSMKKYAMLIQNIGRVFRAEFPIVLHLVDNDDIFKNHWYKARKWYISRGGTITDLNIPNTEEAIPAMNDPESLLQEHNEWVQEKIKEFAEAQKQQSTLVLDIKQEPTTNTQPTPILDVKQEPTTNTQSTVVLDVK